MQSDTISNDVSGILDLQGQGRIFVASYAENVPTGHLCRTGEPGTVRLVTHHPAVIPDPEPIVRAPTRPEDDPARLYVASLGTKKSRRTAVTTLKRLAILLGETDWTQIPWKRVTARETTMIRAILVEQTGLATVRLTMAMLRGVLKQAWRIGLISTDHYQRAIDTTPIQGASAPIGRMLTAEEVRRLFEFAAGVPRPRGAMFLALLALAIGGGLRRAEIAQLGINALADDNQHILVMGKGRKEAIQPLPAGSGAFVAAWVEAMPLGAERMFPWDEVTLWRFIREIRQGAGVAKFTPHDLRRTYASHLFGKTDLHTVQLLMRHASPVTTVGYDRREDEVRERVVQSIDDWWREDPKPAEPEPAADTEINALAMDDAFYRNPGDGKTLRRK